MTLVSWLIVLLPFAFIMAVAFYSKRYVRDVTDYLASGRVAGRYVISVGDLSAGLSVITLVSMCEAQYLTGLAINFWAQLTMPISMLMALSGYCIYRFRETRCLSCGQFLELRYSRNIRIVACAIRAIAEMITNAIGPAVAVRFFIYFIGLPFQFEVFGFQISTYTIMVALLLICALLIILPGGRISLLVTDSFQGIISYPIFVIFTVFILTNMSWFEDAAPVLLDRAAGESFIDPYDISSLRDFNLFALIVTIIGSVLNRAAWIGNDTTSSGRTAHEQKMTFRLMVDKILGIDENYTKGDKIIAWSVMLWTVGFNFVIMFLGVIVWNMFSPWSGDDWSVYFYITSIFAALAVGAVSTVWFLIGGIVDTKALFRDLKARVANPLDNGQVVGHVSLCDVEHFEELEHEIDKGKE